MSERWYKEAVIYCVEVEHLPGLRTVTATATCAGLISRLDYLARLGVTCLWLNPIHPTPEPGRRLRRQRLLRRRSRGSAALGDFVELHGRRRPAGIRILIDLVVNHTSDQHPWFQSARADPGLAVPRLVRLDRRRAAGPPPGHRSSPASRPRRGPTTSRPSAWYFHRFYDFQPDLNWSNPEVRARDQARSWRFWLQLGASGFRIDAAPFVLEQVTPGRRSRRRWTSPSSTTGDRTCSGGTATPSFSCEANVDAEDRCPKYCTAGAGGPNDRAHMLFDFVLNPKLWLALARRRRRTARRGPHDRCPRLPAHGAVGDVPAQPRRAGPRAG